MDIIDIARTVFRRWYAVVPVLLVTAGLAYWTAVNAEQTYETAGSFLLADAAMVGGSEQPAWEASVTPQVVSEVVQGDEVRLRVREAGGTVDYEVAAEGTEGLVRIRAVGDNQQSAVTAVQVLIEEIQRELDERQERAGVPEQRRNTAEILSSAVIARQEVVEDDDAVRYVATGALRFTLPTETGLNRYALSLDGTARVLEEVMLSPAVARDILGEAGGDASGATYEVTMRPRDSAPIINVAASATSAQATMDTFTAVADRMAAELRQRQEVAGAPESSMLTLQPLAVPVGVTVAGGELRRPLLVIVGLGLVAAISLAVLVEGLAMRSRRDRRRRGTPKPPREPLPGDGRVGQPQKVSQTVHGG